MDDGVVLVLPFVSPMNFNPRPSKYSLNMNTFLPSSLLRLQSRLPISASDKSK